MKEVVIVDAIRTPIGKGNLNTGYYRDTRTDELAAHLIQELLKRNPIDPKDVEDVIMGCVMQQEENGLNVARQIALLSGLPVDISAQTVNRLCGSSLQALHSAVQSIISNCGDVYIVGGIEHMTHLPMDKGFNPNPKLFKDYSKATFNMGITTEFLTMKYGISRMEQDEFSFKSHQKAVKAIKNGSFKDEIISQCVRSEDGTLMVTDIDQGPREDTSIEALSKLKPAFNPQGGSVTAGNSSQISDGASIMLVMSLEKAKEYNLKPLAKVKAMATAGVDPSLFGIGPVFATQKALKRANLTLNDIQAIELNEAFAAQSIAVIRDLKIDQSRLNLNGGAIALGHPLGCSGSRIATTLLHIMQRNKLNLGLATMCIGMGQGIATIFESMN